MKDASRLWITAEGKAALIAEQEALKKRVRKIRAERSNAPSDARSGGSGGCGCSLPDTMDDEQNQLDHRIQEIQTTLDRVRVAPPPVNVTHLAIGHIATFMYRVGKNKKVYEYRRIVGYHEGCCETTPISVSYRLPDVKGFIGASKGYSEMHMRQGKMRDLRLTNIRYDTQ